MTVPGESASATRQFAATPHWRSRLEDAIENVAGVIECAVWPVTGSVLIRFDPDLTSAAYLLQILDQRAIRTSIAGSICLQREVRWFRAGQHVAGTGGRRRDGSPVLAAGLRRPPGRLESPYVPRRRTATASRAVRAAGSVHEHRGGNPGQRTVHRIGRDELDAHVLGVAGTIMTWQALGAGC